MCLKQDVYWLFLEVSAYGFYHRLQYSCLNDNDTGDKIKLSKAARQIKFVLYAFQQLPGTDIDKYSYSWPMFLLFLLEVMASCSTFLINVASHCNRPEKNITEQWQIFVAQSMTPLRQQFVADASKEQKSAVWGRDPFGYGSLIKIWAYVGCVLYFVNLCFGSKN